MLWQLGIIIVVAMVVASAIVSFVALNLMTTEWYCKRIAKASTKMTSMLMKESESIELKWIES